MNKKGLVPLDLADLVQMSLLIIVLILVVGLGFFGSLSASDHRALTNIKAFKQSDAALNNLHVRMYWGFMVEPGRIDDFVAKSKSLGGKTITTCNDYLTEIDCDEDTVNILNVVPDAVCVWDKDTAACTMFVLPGQDNK